MEFPSFDVSFAGKLMFMNTQLEKVFDKICGMAVCCSPADVRTKDLVSLYDSLGRAAYALDNMFYERMGLSCKDVIHMLENPDIKI